MHANPAAFLSVVLIVIGAQLALSEPSLSARSAIGAETSGLNVQQTDLGTFGHPDAISISPDGSTVAVVERRDVRTRVDALGLNMKRSGVHPYVHLKGVIASTNAIAFPMFSTKINKWVWCVDRTNHDRREYLSEHDALSVAGGSFASDGGFGYAAKNGETWRIVVNKEEFRFERFKDIKDRLVFSPDGKHWACAGTLPSGEQELIRDGVPQRLKCSWIDRVTFSPDSKRVAYVAELEELRQCYVVDGVPNESFDGIYYSTGGPSLFSKDSSSYAYTAKVRDRSVVVVNGKLHENSASHPMLSANGNVIVTTRTAQNDERQGVHISINKKLGKKYKSIDNVQLSPNNRRVAYYAVDAADGKQYFVVEDVVTREVVAHGPYGNGVHIPFFDATSADVWYAAQLQDKWHLFRSGVKITEKGSDEFLAWDGIPALRCSRDRKHVAVVGLLGERARVVVDGIEGPSHPRKPDYFSVTPGHFEELDGGLFYRYMAGRPWSWGFTVQLMSVKVPAS